MKNKDAENGNQSYICSINGIFNSLRPGDAYICVIEMGHHIHSGNGLSPVRRQAFYWTNAHLLSSRPFGTNFSEILIKIQNFSFTKMYLKMSCAKLWPVFCQCIALPRREFTLKCPQCKLLSGHRGSFCACAHSIGDDICIVASYLSGWAHT